MLKEPVQSRTFCPQGREEITASTPKCLRWHEPACCPHRGLITVTRVRGLAYRGERVLLTFPMESCLAVDRFNIGGHPWKPVTWFYII